MHFRQFLMRERRPEIGVALAEQPLGLVPNLGTQLVVTRPPAALRDQPLRARLTVAAQEPFHMPHADSQLFRCFSLFQTLFFQPQSAVRTSLCCMTSSRVSSFLLIVSSSSTFCPPPGHAVSRDRKRGHYYFGLTVLNLDLDSNHTIGYCIAHIIKVSSAVAASVIRLSPARSF